MLNFINNTLINVPYVDSAFENQYIGWWRNRLWQLDTGFDRSYVCRPIKRFRYSDKIRQQKKSSKGRKPDSFNRERKLKEFRNNDKTPSRYPFGKANGTKKHSQIAQNRSERREVRMLIQQGKFEEVITKANPRNIWDWS